MKLDLFLDFDRVGLEAFLFLFPLFLVRLLRIGQVELLEHAAGSRVARNRRLGERHAGRDCGDGGESSE